MGTHDLTAREKRYLLRDLSRDLRQFPHLADDVEQLVDALQHAHTYRAAAWGLEIGYRVAKSQAAGSTSKTISKTISYVLKPLMPVLDKAGRGMRSVTGARESKGTKAQKRHSEISAAVGARLLDHPRDSLDFARHRVAEEHCDAKGKPLPGWSYATIRRVTLRLKKPKRK
jgi:hypothetical protein